MSAFRWDTDKTFLHVDKKQTNKTILSIWRDLIGKFIHIID